MAVVGGLLLIFFARVADVSMAILRTLLIVRGERLRAACIGFFEALIYVLALSVVVKSLNQPVNLIAYALGFAAGNYGGSFIEEKIALGSVTVQVISGDKSRELIDTLRSEGFGVTEMQGHGRTGARRVIFIGLPRKNLPQVLSTIDQISPDAFITVMDTRTTYGGYFTRKSK